MKKSTLFALGMRRVWRNNGSQKHKVDRSLYQTATLQMSFLLTLRKEIYTVSPMDSTISTIYIYDSQFNFITQIGMFDLQPVSYDLLLSNGAGQLYLLL